MTERADSEELGTLDTQETAPLKKNGSILLKDTNSVRYHCHRVSVVGFSFNRWLDIDFAEHVVRLYSVRTGGKRKEFPVQNVVYVRDFPDEPTHTEVVFGNHETTMLLVFDTPQVCENFKKNLRGLRNSGRLDHAQHTPMRALYFATTVESRLHMRRVRLTSILLQVVGWALMFLSVLGDPGSPRTSALFYTFLVLSLLAQLVGDAVSRFRHAGRDWLAVGNSPANVLGLFFGLVGILLRTGAWFYARSASDTFAALLCVGMVVKRLGNYLSSKWVERQDPLYVDVAPQASLDDQDKQHPGDIKLW